MDSGANAPRKLIWAVLLALTLAMTAVLALPHEAHAVEVGDFEVEGGALNTDYTYSSNVLTIKTNTPLTISMKEGVSETTSDAILVDADGDITAQVTLQGVEVDMTAKFNTAAMSVRSGSLALVLPEGTKNSLESGSWHAGLESGDNSLTISGGGTLVATGGTDGAGIGGSSGTGSKIKIEGSATVEATGGEFAAGIGGGGSGGSGKGITISGYATVTARGGASGAGIGGGNGGTGSEITIEDTTKVEATGGTHGAGVGGGSVGSGTGITISGSATVTAKGGNFAAGIGGGDGGSGSNIKIEGSTTVEATAGDFAAGIGGGSSGTGADITISGFATVTAKGGTSGAGIGGGNKDSGSKIKIEGSATVEATGGGRGAGIGGGDGGSGTDDITIKDSASVTAKGGDFAAGIGGGDGGSGSNIFIAGGYVKATAGARGSAQPIGNGYNASGTASVSITGGAFADTGWSAEKVYGIELASGYFPDDNNEEASEADYPVRVYEYGVVTLEFEDTMTFEYAKTSVSPSDILKTAERGGDDATLFVEWSYRLKDSTGAYESGTPTDAGVYEVRAVLPLHAPRPGVRYPELTATVTLTVSPKALTATVNESDPSASKVYDGKATFTGVKLTLSDVITGDDVVLAPVEGTAASADAGTQSFTTSSATLSGVDAHNYTLDVATGVTGKVTIAPKPLTATVNESDPSASKVYDGKATFTDVKLTFSDIIAGDDVSATAEGTAADAKVGSSKAFSASTVSLSGADAGNYTLATSDVTGTVAIAPKPLTAKVDSAGPSASKVYDGAATFTGVKLTLSDVITGDDVSATAEGTVVDAKVGSNKAFSSSSVSLSGADAGNYTLAASDVTGTVAIAPKPLTATVNESDPSASKVYDGKATFTDVKLTLLDVITGDDVVLAPVEGTAASADAGTQSFTASSATLSGADAGNYTLATSDVTGTVAIAPKPLTATVDSADSSASKVYDGKGTFTGVKLTLSDIIAGDDVSATAEGTAADAKVGSSKAFSASTVSLSGADAGNYTLAASDVTGAVTIKAATPIPLPPPDGKDAASGGSTLAPTGDTTFGSALVALTLAIASAATLAVVRFRRRTN